MLICVHHRFYTIKYLILAPSYCKHRPASLSVQQDIPAARFEIEGTFLLTDAKVFTYFTYYSVVPSTACH